MRVWARHEQWEWVVRQVVTASFDPDVGSVRAVRGFVRDCLADRSDIEIDLILLLASELATNAVVHAGTDFEVYVESASPCVRVTVEDRSAELPVLRHPSTTDVGGRGLEMIDAVADEWGYEMTFLGKRVWFDICG